MQQDTQQQPTKADDRTQALLQQARQVASSVSARFQRIRSGQEVLRFDEATGEMSEGHAVRSTQAAVVEQLVNARGNLSAEDVKFLDSYLQKYQQNGSHYADGSYGADTKTLVGIYQKANGIAVDGTVGKETLGTIEQTSGKLGYKPELERTPLPTAVVTQFRTQGNSPTSPVAPVTRQIPTKAAVPSAPAQIPKPQAENTWAAFAKSTEAPAAVAALSSPKPVNPQAEAAPVAAPEAEQSWAAFAKATTSGQTAASTQPPAPATPSASNGKNIWSRGLGLPQEGVAPKEERAIAKAPASSTPTIPDVPASGTVQRKAPAPTASATPTIPDEPEVAVAQLAPAAAPAKVAEVAPAAMAPTEAAAEVVPTSAVEAVTTQSAPETVTHDLLARAKQFYEAAKPGFTGWGTEEDALLESLRGLNKTEIAELRSIYKDHYGRELDADTFAELSGSYQNEAEYLLSGSSADATALQLIRSADQWFGEAEAILKTLEGKTADEIRAIDSALTTKHGTTLENFLSDNLSGVDLERGNALLQNELNAHGHNIAADRIALTELIANEEFDEAFALLEARTAEEITFILRTDEALDQRLLTTVKALDETDPQRDRLIGLLNNDPTVALLSEARIAITHDDQTKLLDLLEKVGTEQIEALSELYKASYEEDFKIQAAALINDNRGWWADAGEKILADTTMIPAYRLEMATDGWGTDEQLIRKVLESGVPYQKLSSDYNILFEKNLTKSLAWDLGGSDQTHAERIKRGEAQSLEQAIGFAEEDAQHERGFISRKVYETAEFITYGAGKGNLLDANVEKLREIYNEAVKDGEVTDAERQILVRQLTYVQQDLGTYSEAKKAASEAVGTTLATAGAAAVVIGSGGTLTPLVVAGAAAAGAGGYTVGKGLTQGVSYNFDGVLGDAAIGAVDGVVTAVGGKVITAAATPIVSGGAALAATQATLSTLKIPGAEAVSAALSQVATPASWLASEAMIRARATGQSLVSRVVLSDAVQGSMHTAASVAGAGVNLASSIAEKKSVQAALHYAQTGLAKGQELGIQALNKTTEVGKAIYHSEQAQTRISAVQNFASHMSERTATATAAVASLRNNEALQSGTQFVVNNFGDGALAGATSEGTRALAEGASFGETLERISAGATAGAIGAGATRAGFAAHGQAQAYRTAAANARAASAADAAAAVDVPVTPDAAPAANAAAPDATATTPAATEAAPNATVPAAAAATPEAAPQATTPAAAGATPATAQVSNEVEEVLKAAKAQQRDIANQHAEEVYRKDPNAGSPVDELSTLAFIGRNNAHEKISNIMDGIQTSVSDALARNDFVEASRVITASRDLELGTAMKPYLDQLENAVTLAQGASS